MTFTTLVPSAIDIIEGPSGNQIKQIKVLPTEKIVCFNEKCNATMSGQSSTYPKFTRKGLKGNSQSYSKNCFSYGNKRNRKPIWERSREKRRLLQSKDGRLSPSDGTPPRPQKQVASKEELAKIISVQKVNFHIEENTKNHRTDEYACTSDREYESKKLPAELVIRRGDTFKITITFNREYNKEKDDLKLCFATGEVPKPSKGTKAVFEVDESGKTNFKPDEWGAALQNKNGSNATLLVHIPSNCIIGEWNLSINTIFDEKDESGQLQKKVFEYNHHEDITILFNPWCKEDGVYMEKDADRQEYILNDKGIIYWDNASQIKEKKWIYGQFEEEILEAALELLTSGYKDGVSLDMADPVGVSRMIAQMVNSDDDNGVLVGKWPKRPRESDFKDGTPPLKWAGSVHIMRQYRKTGPVKYGQSSAFSGVTTTVCRALGIPCRPVTNFCSAHDDDGTNTIEIYYYEGDPDTFCTTDSIWTYHVWNELWMSRPDLKDLNPGCEFLRSSGWQALDATPQEKSAGVYRCGPCPVRAVRLGYGTVNFDTNFVFSEVNADIAHWNYTNGDYELMAVETKKIGKQICTKKANDDAREDITLEYKPAEGSQEERDMVAMALETAKTKSHLKYFDTEIAKETVKFHLLHDNDTMVGNNLKIELTAKNTGSRDRKILSPTITVAGTYYYGLVTDVFFTKSFDDIVLKKGEGSPNGVMKVEVDVKDYLPHVGDESSFIIEATAKVEKAAGEKEQVLHKKHYFGFKLPDLKVMGPAKVKQGQVASFEVSFQNPLNSLELKNCTISTESSGCQDVYDVKQADVKPSGLFKQTVSLKACRMKKNAAVNFIFDCDQLKNISGGCLINIEQA